MKNQEWLRQVSNLTGLPYYEQHRIFGDKSGAVIGVTDGYVVAIGLGKIDNGRNAAVKMLMRYAKTLDPQQVKEALEPLRGKFKVVVDETTANLVRTYSFSKPDAADVAEKMRELLTALKTCALPINAKCEECGKADQQLTLLNDAPVYYCSSCQVQLTQKLDQA